VCRSPVQAGTELAFNRTFLKCREAALESLRERARFVEAAE
jgi:hypothetical protein